MSDDAVVPVVPAKDPDAPLASDEVTEAAPGRSRSATLFVSLAIGLIVLLALVIFIAQNDQRTKITFLGIHGHIHEGVGFLFSAIVGGLVVVIAGTIRILELKRRARRDRRDYRRFRRHNH